MRSAFFDSAPAAPRSGRTARPERGFTDSELSDRLIPLVIVGILIAIAIPSYRNYKATVVAKQDLEAIEAAQREHRKKNGTWVAFAHAHGKGDRALEALALELAGTEDVAAIAEAGSNGALVLRASGGRLKKPIERRVQP